MADPVIEFLVFFVGFAVLYLGLVIGLSCLLFPPKLRHLRK